jgi:hypothetical protein
MIAIWARRIENLGPGANGADVAIEHLLESRRRPLFDGISNASSTSPEITITITFIAYVKSELVVITPFHFESGSSPPPDPSAPLHCITSDHTTRAPLPRLSRALPPASYDTFAQYHHGQEQLQSQSQY